MIVGAGITGLAAAYALQREAPDAEVVVLEREKRLGGKIWTERFDGFVIEGGPDSFLTSKPGGLNLCRALGIEDDLEGTKPAQRRTFVLRRGRLFEMPQGLSGLVPSRLAPLFRSNLFSPRGKLRMAMEAILPPRRDSSDESLGGFMRRRFGREAYERLIEPLMSGIYGGNGEQLSLQATFPQLLAMEQRSGSLIRGIRAAPAPPPGRPKPAFVTPIQGMASIVEALEMALDTAVIRREASVEMIRPGGATYEIELAGGEIVGADAVIVAAPAHAAARFLAATDLDIAAALDAIPYASTATISLAYAPGTVPEPEGYGYVVPRAEDRPVLACTWTSSKFANRAPDGYTLLRAFVGRAGREEILEQPDEALVATVRRELREVLDIDAEPLWSRNFRWPNAMPQYTVGHLERVQRIDNHLANHPGLFLAGSAYRGVGIPDCITSGERAAVAAATYLHRGAAALP